MQENFKTIRIESYTHVVANRRLAFNTTFWSLHWCTHVLNLFGMFMQICSNDMVKVASFPVHFIHFLLNSFLKWFPLVYIVLDIALCESLLALTHTLHKFNTHYTYFHKHSHFCIFLLYNWSNEHFTFLQWVLETLLETNINILFINNLFKFIFSLWVIFAYWLFYFAHTNRTWIKPQVNTTT